MSGRRLLALNGVATLAARTNSPPGASAPEQPLDPAPQLVSGATAVEHAYGRGIDPASMSDAEIGQLVSAANRCTFRYTAISEPVLGTGSGARRAAW